MDPPKISYIDHNSIMVINPSGKMKQLFVPFKAQVIYSTATLVKDACVFVEEVRQHDKYILIYRVAGNWWPYYVFRLAVNF